MIRIKAGDIEYPLEILASEDPYYRLSVNDKVYWIKKTFNNSSELSFDLDDKEYTIYYSRDKREMGFISFAGHIFEMQRSDFLSESISNVRFESDGHSNEVFSPMPGKVIQAFVNTGDKVNKGDVLVIIEAMKMENTIISPIDGLVSSINVVINDRVDSGKALISIEEQEN